MVWEVCVTSSVLILGIFLLRRLSMGKISMRLRYALWLLVAVRLLLPVTVATSPFSVLNVLPEAVSENAQVLSVERGSARQQSAGDGWDAASVGKTDKSLSDGKAGAEPADGDGKAETDITAGAEALMSGEAVPKKQVVAGADAVRRQEEATGEAVGGLVFGSFTVSGILGTLWLLGFLAVGGYMVISKWRLTGYLLKNREAFPSGAIPAAFAERFARRGMKVYQVKGLPAPCLSGRHIYIGEGDAARPKSLTHILAHEYCHALHGDRLWAFLRCAFSAVYWFDPFVWAAAYAARQDSELACDEAAVRLLGEPERFAYGRTLLALLEGAGDKRKCPGMSFMTEGGERKVRERITALAKKRRMKGSVLAVVCAAVVFLCGCAFTGAEQGAGQTVDGQETAQAETLTGEQGKEPEETLSQAEKFSTVNAETKILSEEEGALLQKEYGDAVKTETLTQEQIKELEESARQEADRAAFEECLNYYGVMEGKDDGELSLNRKVDYRTYYEFTKGEAENPMENGWYLVCKNEDAGIALYGLYTEEFGFRGLKTLIGGDVNTYDIQWCASGQNSDSDNIRVLERAQDGLPRSFVWKLPVQESGTVEIWRLYGGYRYDTGTIDLKTLTEEDCVEWAKKYLGFDVDQEAAKVHVTCDGDMYLGAIDISAYGEWKTEDVQIVPDAVAFSLDGQAGENAGKAGEEGLAVHLVAGLKLEGAEGLWFNGLPLLTVQIVEDENSDSGFRLQSPRIDEQFVAKAPWQEKELKELGMGHISVISKYVPLIIGIYNRHVLKSECFKE